MGKTATLQERQDAEGSWHQVLKDVCYWCSCAYVFAEDDHDLVWEPGKHRDARCSDDVCECHTRPVIGRHRD
jgi:hypothetical protein